MNWNWAQEKEYETLATAIQSVKQKMTEAGHVQRQYKAIGDVIDAERIGHAAQLQQLQQAIAHDNSQAAKLGVKHSNHF